MFDYLYENYDKQDKKKDTNIINKNKEKVDSKINDKKRITKKLNFLTKKPVSKLDDQFYKELKVENEENTNEIVEETKEYNSSNKNVSKKNLKDTNKNELLKRTGLNINKKNYNKKENFNFKNKDNLVKFNIKHKYGDKLKTKNKYMANGKLKSNYFNKNNFDKDEDTKEISERVNIKIKDMSAKIMVTKDNIYFELMNESLKVLLLSKNNKHISKEKFDEKLSSFYLKPICNYKDLFNSPDKLKIILKEFNYEHFYKFQKEAIHIVNTYKKCFINVFTGGGKSLLFQINPFLSDNITIVISPFIAITLDQIKKIPKNVPSCVINSWLKNDQKKQIFNLIKENKIRILIITPEMFTNEVGLFLLNNKIKIDTICIDEAHCSSIYSHNFRPSYLIISDLIKRLQVNIEEEIKLLFLSATTNVSILNYIKDLYNLEDKMIIKSDISFKNNLKINFVESDKLDKNTDLLNFLGQRKEQKKPVLVYCSFKYSSEIISRFLKQNLYYSEFFHMDLTDIQKMNILSDFLNSNVDKNEYNTKESFRNIDIIVSTISLSMGLDHSNIRGIYHFNIPYNIESYIQQIGRAGRDDKESICQLFLKTEDFYFTKNKIVSDYIVTDSKLRKIINYLFEKKSYLNKKKKFIIKNSGDRYFYIKKSMISDDLNIEYDLFIKFLVFIKNIFDEYKLDFKFNCNCNISGSIYIRKSNEFLNHEFYTNNIKKFEKIKGNIINFNIVKLANFIKIDPYDLILKIKEYSNEYNFSFFANEQMIYFEFNYGNFDLNKNINDIIKKLKIQINKILKILSQKAELLYGLIRFYIKNNKCDNVRERFIYYINLYFQKTEKDMIEILKKEINFMDLVKLFYIDSNDKYNKYLLDDIQDYINKFYNVF